MGASPEILVIAADPLLRKAVTETLTALSDGGVEAITPVRVTPERVGAAEVVVIAATDGNLADLEKGLAVVAAAGRPVILVAVGGRDAGGSVATRLAVPPALRIAIPDLNVRDELSRAAPRLHAALKQARMPGSRSPEPAQPPVPAAKTGMAPRQPERPGGPEGRPPGMPYLGPVVCIGASTGGTDALLSVLSGLPRDCAPIAIVQHMPEAYVGAFAGRLDQSCAIDVALAADGVALRPGLAVVGPGGRQFRLRKDARGIWTSLGEADRIGGHCPAADELMKSAAQELGRRAIGILLTGMGRDGADGLLAMRRAGARTAAQDEATSVVYGMPKAAMEIGAADSILALSRIAGWISGLTPTLRK